MAHRFGTFEFDSQALELRKQGRVVPLEPQPTRALALLLSRAGEVVTRDDLKQVLWGEETHVDFDRGLAYCLSQVRQALGDSGANPRFVETLPRRGYRFVAPVSDDAPPTEEPSRAPTAWWRRHVRAIVAATAIATLVGGGVWWSLGVTSPARAMVVAVSVFDNETGNAEHDALVSALSDAVVVRLANLEPTRLSVVGNAEVLRRPRNIRNLKAVANAVEADFVILGQLQEASGRWRFVTHLVRLPDETHLKANRLEMAIGDRSSLEQMVIAEFDAAVRHHVLAGDASNSRATSLR